MASDATPRINAKYLDAFANKTVRVLGKVVSLRGETAMLEANGSIVVHLNRVRATLPSPSDSQKGKRKKEEAISAEDEARGSVCLDTLNLPRNLPRSLT